jgi:hypothetical protein
MNTDHVLDQLARIDPAALTDRLDRAALAQLAQALNVARSGTKADVAQRITNRARLALRTAELGTDPRRVAATLRRSTLVGLVAEWDGWTGANKYGLAAQVIARNEQLRRSLTADLAEPARPGHTRQPRLFPTRA